MDGYGLFLEVMAFLSRIIPIFFFETWLPLFSLFFLGHASLACHLFSFWGNHNLTLFYFRDVLRERSPRHGAFINVEWMDGGANSQYSKWMGRVRAYDRESMKSISLGSHNLTKLNRTSSNICVRFFMEYDIWLW